MIEISSIWVRLLISDAATALTEATVKAVVFGDLTTFQKGSELFLNSSVSNSGILGVSPFFDPTLNELQVLDLLTSRLLDRILKSIRSVPPCFPDLMTGILFLFQALFLMMVSMSSNTMESRVIPLTFEPNTPFTSFVTSCRFIRIDFQRPRQRRTCPTCEYVYKVTPPSRIRTTMATPTWRRLMLGSSGSGPNDSSTVADFCQRQR